MCLNFERLGWYHRYGGIVCVANSKYLHRIFNAIFIQMITNFSDNMNKIESEAIIFFLSSQNCRQNNCNTNSFQ